jgi:hypothetical protein
MSRALLFFGFTERGLTISRAGHFEDVNVDYAGSMPADVSMLGQNARISGDFTQYNEQVAEANASFVFGAVGGAGPNNSVGTLMTLEEGSIPLVIYAPYGAKDEFGTMVSLFYFPSTYLVDNYEFQISVRRKAPRVSWRAIPIFGSYVSNVFQAGLHPYNAYVIYQTTPPTGYTISDLIELVD